MSRRRWTARRYARLDPYDVTLQWCPEVVPDLVDLCTECFIPYRDTYFVLRPPVATVLCAACWREERAN